MGDCLLRGPAEAVRGPAAPPERRPRTCLRHGRIAQLVEQLTLNQRVLGSSPSASTTFPLKIRLDIALAALSAFHEVTTGNDR